MTQLVGTLRSLKQNLIYNGTFEYAPAFVAATSTVGKWIDGTATGGTALTSSWGWLFFFKVGTAQAQFDNTVSFSGGFSLKCSTLAITSQSSCSNTLSASLVDLQRSAIVVNPSTNYTLTFMVKLTVASGSATTGAFVGIREYNDQGLVPLDYNSSTVTTTTGWTLITKTFTTSAAGRFIRITPTLVGNDGTGTLIGDAWFDDIILTTNTTPVRPTVA